MLDKTHHINPQVILDEASDQYIRGDISYGQLLETEKKFEVDYESAILEATSLRHKAKNWFLNFLPWPRFDSAK
jgi:hypothetical protein